MEHPPVERWVPTIVNDRSVFAIVSWQLGGLCSRQSAGRSAASTILTSRVRPALQRRAKESPHWLGAARASHGTSLLILKGGMSAADGAPGRWLHGAGRGDPRNPWKGNRH